MISIDEEGVMRRDGQEVKFQEGLNFLYENGLMGTLSNGFNCFLEFQAAIALMTKLVESRHNRAGAVELLLPTGKVYFKLNPDMVPVLQGELVDDLEVPDFKYYDQIATLKLAAAGVNPIGMMHASISTGN